MIGLGRECARAGSRAPSGKYGPGGIPLLIRVLEEACRHNTFPVDDKSARVRNPVRAGARLRLFVQDAKAPDDRGPRVGDQREPDSARVGELLQRRRRIVTDRNESEPLLADLIVAALQLDELRLAVGSPIGGAEEHEHRALWAE